MNGPRNLSHHTLALLVENRAGVLGRVTDLIARRGYNIISLAVAPTNDDRFSRITIVVDVETALLEQIVKQLFKLINVIEIVELSPTDAVSRELMLATIRVSPDSLVALEAIMTYSAGHILELDRSSEFLTLSAGGSSAELDDLQDALAKFDIVEVQRTGQIALPKLGRSVPIMRAR